jgi:hypothetical protein
VEGSPHFGFLEEYAALWPASVARQDRGSWWVAAGRCVRESECAAHSGTRDRPRIGPGTTNRLTVGNPIGVRMAMTPLHAWRAACHTKDGPGHECWQDEERSLMAAPNKTEWDARLRALRHSHAQRSVAQSWRCTDLEAPEARVDISGRCCDRARS